MAVLSRNEIEEIVRGVISKRVQELGYRPAPTLTVHASARHMHVSREHLDILFGPGYELTPFRPLYQPGNYAANETVTLIGPRSRLISNLRILGPTRPESQIELAYTDAISLGFDNVPVRISGDIKGTPGGFVMGPKGMVELKQGIIRAAMHVHMNPAEAAYYGVKHGDMMKLRVGGEAAVTFEKVRVRVHPEMRLDVHMDTDEANACGLHQAKEIVLVK